MSSSQFVDYVKIYCKSGDGGAGSVHFRKEKFIPKGGPDGGDGGDGGSIILEGSRELWTLLPLKYKRHQRATSGQNGGKSRLSGAKGEDLIIKIPIGTVAKNEKGETLFEITKNAQRKILLKGGKGGKGNWHYKSARRQAPRYAQEGIKGQEATIVLELKILADAGMVGFPNAGKSTLLSVLSAAKPKIANYPFTTLNPHIGVVPYKEEDSFVLADIPGIIQGASQNKGLGHKFLRHIERCSLLLFLISAEDKEISKKYEILLEELKGYDPSLIEKPRLIVISKSDLISTKKRNALETQFSNLQMIFISSFSKENLELLKNLLWEKIYFAKAKT